MLRNARVRSIGGGRRRYASLFVVVFITAFFVAFIGPDVSAQFAEADTQVQNVAEAADVGGTTDLIEIIGRLINVFLGFVGVILLIILLYAGFLWMTAGGDAEKVQRAKDWIKNAIIGLIILVSAFAIVRFIFSFFEDGGLRGVVTSEGIVPGGGFPTGVSSLGKGIIEMHYPLRFDTDVARNAAIMVTFKRPMKISSIIAGYNDNGTPSDLEDDYPDTDPPEGVNSTAVKIYRTDQSKEGAFTSDRMRVRFTADRRTFVFRPVDLLGSSATTVNYTVFLEPGADGLLFEDNTLVSEDPTAYFAEGYNWPFETGTHIDLTPPRILGVFPYAGERYYRNIITQIQFNEAVDPTAATGIITNGGGFENVRLMEGDGDLSVLPSIDGEWKISNQYRTIEFVPAEECGVNSCGEIIYCLPGGGTINAYVQAASLEEIGEPTAQFTAGGFDGVVDVAANSLDGDGDGEAQGQPDDDYFWFFTTLLDENRIPPIIEYTYPSSDLTDIQGRSNADPFDPVRARFDTILQSSTFNTDNAYISDVHEDEIYDSTFWYGTGQDFLTADNSPVESVVDIPVKSEGYIIHRTYAEDTLYDPYLLSGIRNAYQNCFNPVSYEGKCLGTPNCCNNVFSGDSCEEILNP